MNHVADVYNLRGPGLFYVDAYPIQREALLVVSSPELAAQVTQISSYPKHPALNRGFGRAIGKRGIVVQEGAHWKELRTMFNPGFSQANLLSMVPMMVDEAQVFAFRLSASAAAGGFVRSLESFVADLTVDVIGQALLGIRFNSQNSSNATVTNLIEASRLVRPLFDFSIERLNLWRILKLRYYEALANIKTFTKLIPHSIKTFIFAGHDTTSSVLAYAFYELSRHPKILEEVRAEHADVFGSDPEVTAKRLKEDPNLANTLPLTTAVIREILRLYPTASTIRMGPKGSQLIGKDGKSYPTSGAVIWVANSITMRDPEFFPSPDSFIPHRFLPDKSPFPPIPKNAYRPFEKGPRDCIGQELAMLESRVGLSLTLRRFDFKAAYEELDRRLGKKEEVYKHCVGVGERAYQVLVTTAKPKDGLPMWVSERET
ncbi:cytochrome P450 [Xylogone sp. PMI_703]|nr:cytochrome P450 [Xylogone sp. PMI_703]